MSKAPGGSRIPVGPGLKQPTTSKLNIRRVIQDSKTILTEKILTSKHKPLTHNDEKKEKPQANAEKKPDTVVFKGPGPSLAKKEKIGTESKQGTNTKVDQTFDVTKIKTLDLRSGCEIQICNDTFEYQTSNRPDLTIKLPNAFDKTFPLVNNVKLNNENIVKDRNIQVKLAEHIGARVKIIYPDSNNFEKRGTLRYVGHMRKDCNIWCGVETDILYINQHDGTEDDVKYFNCEFGYGTLVPMERVRLETVLDNRFENPRIAELRSRFENVNKKNAFRAESTPKRQFNDATQCLVDDEFGENSQSGPFSLLVGFKPSQKTPGTLNATSDPNRLSWNVDVNDTSTPIASVLPQIQKKIVHTNIDSEQESNSNDQTCVGNIDGESAIDFFSITSDNVNDADIRNDCFSQCCLKNDGFLLDNMSAVSFKSIDSSLSRVSEQFKRGTTTDTLELTAAANNVEPKEKYKVDILNYNLKFSSQAEENFRVDNIQRNTRETMKLDLLSPTAFSESSNRQLSGQNSFEESLGILTPDQMESISLFDNMRSPSVENLHDILSDSRIGDKTLSTNSDTPSTEKHDGASTNVNKLKYCIPGNSHMLDEDIFNKTCVSEVHTNYVGSGPVNIVVNNLNVGNENRLSFGSLIDLDNQIDSFEFFVKKPFKQSAAENQEQLSQGYAVIINDDELLSSVRSSILDPPSSVIDTTVNLELSLDSKNCDLLGVANVPLNRVDLTPSPEELPLDPIENYTTSRLLTERLCDSTSQDSHTDSDLKTDLAKSMETSKVSSSFITSVTSITSLDGYQGDGEMSRPVSRGAEESPTIGHRIVVNPPQWQNIPINRRPDPMTDSDFFTESDADVHDEHVNRGDRKAQVIDGALYGGVNLNAAPPVIVSRNDDSCMESSGVYTDVENQRGSPVLLNAVVDLSPGSTVSTHSDSTGSSQNIAFNQTLNVTVTEKQNSKEGTVGHTKHVVQTNAGDKCSRAPDSSSLKDRNSPSDKQTKDEKNTALKRHKMPRKDVVSKVKSMIDSVASRSDVDQIRERPASKSPKKGNKWDAVMNKIAVNKTENKTRSYKEVKSRVTSSLCAEKTRTHAEAIAVPPKPWSPPKIKSRRIRSRLPEPSHGGVSARSSAHSSQSDVSILIKQISNKHSNNRLAKKRDVVSTTAPGTFQTGAPTEARLLSPSGACPGAGGPDAGDPVAAAAAAAAARPLTAPAAIRPASLKKSLGLPNLNGSPSAASGARAVLQRKQIRTASLSPRLQQQKDQQSRVASAASPTGTNGKAPPAPAARPAAQAIAAARAARLPRGVQAPPPPSQALALARLEHGAKGVEALGVLVHYLVFQLDGLNAPTWRRVAASERAAASRAAQDLSEAREMRTKDHRTIADCLMKISMLENEVSEKNECNSRLLAESSEAEAKYKLAIEETSNLAKDVKGLKATIDELKREVSEGRLRLSKAFEESRAATAAHEAAKREFEDALLRRPETTEVSTNTDTRPTATLVNGESPRAKAYRAAAIEKIACDENAPTESAQAAEVRSLRAVLELKQAEAVELRKAVAAAERTDEMLAAAERRAARLAAHNEELAARTDSLQNETTSLAQENGRLRETLTWEVSQKNNMTKFVEQLRYKLRHNGEVVNLLVGHQNGRRLNRTFPCGDEKVSLSSPPESPRVKAVVEKQDSVSWVLEMDESPEEVAQRLARRANSFRGSPGGPASPASPASPCAQPLKRRDRNGSSGSAGSRSACKLFRSGSAERGAWRPKEVSSPMVRRERAVSLSQEPRARAESVGLPSPPTGITLQESGGEAMISGSESDDERSAGGEPRDADSRTDSDLETDNPIISCRRSRSELPDERGEVDPVLLKIAESIDKSLSATPMEVSWSEDGDCVLVSETEI